MRAYLQQIKAGAQSAQRAWDKFFFRPGDPTVLGIMRWLVGGMLVYTHIVWGLNLEAFFGSSGWNSPDVLEVVQQERIVPSFWWYVSDEWLHVVHYTCVAVLILFWIGFATRVTSVMSWKAPQSLTQAPSSMTGRPMARARA